MLALLVLAGAGLAFVAGRSLSWARELPAYRFDPRRLELAGAMPAWLERPMARALFRGYLEAKVAPFSLLDARALEAYASALRRLPWVRSLEIEARWPDACDLRLELRRPTALVGPRVPSLVAADGLRLPVDPEACPESWAALARDPRGFRAPPPGSRLAGRASTPFGLPRILTADPADVPAARLADAATLAGLLGEDFLPFLRRLVGGALGFELFGVDASSRRPVLLASASRPAYALVCRSGEGRAVYLGWGHGPRCAQIPWEDKARVLAAILREHPGLAGLGAADLRFARRWRERLVRLAVARR